MSFTDEEVLHLRSQPIPRPATLCPKEQPDLVPLGFEFEGTFFWVGGSGQSVLHTRKFRNVQRGRDKVALLIDDMVSLDPFIVRSIRVYGRAKAPVERVGVLGPGFYLRIPDGYTWS